MEKQEQKCKRCLYKWKYGGKKLKMKVDYPLFVQCPRCLTSVKLIVFETEKKGGKK